MVTEAARPVPVPGPSSWRDNLRLTRRMLDDPVPMLDECAQRFGPTFGLGAPPLRLVVVGDPVHLTDVFAQPSSSYRWKFPANVLGFIVGPTSMIVSDGEDHQRRRSAVQPAFARRRLDAWIPMIVAEVDRSMAERIEPQLRAGGTLDVYPPGKDLILGITVRAFFGNGLEHRTQEIGAMFDELQAYLELPGPKQFPHRIPGTQRARARAARHAFDRLVDEEIARRRAAAGSTPEADRGEGADLLDVFVDDDAGLSTREIHDQVNTLIGAGYNTTAATLAWMVHEALAAPGVWERLRAEADDAFDGSVPGPGTYQRLTYARAVVHESLRLHPAGAFAPRQAVADITIGPHLVRKGTMVLWSPYLAGRDAGAWPDPLAFRPERHLDPSPEAGALMDAAWVPFGRGPRRCIGFAFAQLELTLILARLAQRLDLSLVDRTTPAPHGVVVNRPLGGVWVSGTGMTVS